MVEKLKIIAQTLKGYGLHDDGELVYKAALALQQAATTAAQTGGQIAAWRKRAEEAEEANAKLRKGRRTPPDDEITGRVKK